MATVINAQSDEEDTASGWSVLLSTGKFAMHALEVGRGFVTDDFAEDSSNGLSVLLWIGTLSLHVHEVGRGSVTVAVIESMEHS